MTLPAARLGAVRQAFLFGNFVIGCGVMAVVGVLNDLTHALDVSVSRGGQLIAIAAAMMCFGAPLLAGWIGGFDRRRLLTGALLWYAVGHVLCALMPSYEALWPMRALTVLGAAVFTPQAAAAIGAMAPPAERGRNITTIFIGWSVASVAGVPVAAWLGETYGWRIAFGAIGGASAVAAAWVWTVTPDGVRPPTLSGRDWVAVLTSPLLMGTVLVTALAGAGQFTLFSYLAPYWRQVLHASATEISLLFLWFGAFGLIGNTVMSRWVDRIGAANATLASLVLMTVSLVLWPFADSRVAMAIIVIPWGLGCFVSVSAQQARLGATAPAYAPALMALNSSAVYLGQAAGASSGAWIIDSAGYRPLPSVGIAWMAVAIALSIWAARRHARSLA